LKVFHPEFDRLFAFGIDPVEGGLPTDKAADWPSLAEARSYNSQVRQAIDEGLQKTAFSDSRPEGRDFSANILLNVAIENLLMHAETLAYMFHQLPLDQKVRQAHAPANVAGPVQSSMIEIAAGPAILGMSRDDASIFGWDNEYETHAVTVPA